MSRPTMPPPSTFVEPDADWRTGTPIDSQQFDSQLPDDEYSQESKVIERPSVAVKRQRIQYPVCDLCHGPFTSNDVDRIYEDVDLELAAHERCLKRFKKTNFTLPTCPVCKEIIDNNFNQDVYACQEPCKAIYHPHCLMRLFLTDNVVWFDQDCTKCKITKCCCCARPLGPTILRE